MTVTKEVCDVEGYERTFRVSAQTENRELQRQAASHLTNEIFDCSGYYFHLRRCKERLNGPKRKTERDPATVQRYTTMKDFFDCRGELRIAFSKSNRTATITYDHKCHTETPKFHVTEEVHLYIQRLIYQNLIQMADSPQLKNTDLHSITRQQVYNIWLSYTRKEWERDAADDFRSAQLLLEGQEGYRLIEELQEPGVSLAFITPCFSDSLKFDRAKMTEVFIDSTFGTNKHGYELYCVLTEYDLVSLPLSYLLLDTRGVQEDFAEVTAASLAFKRNNDRYNHHLCLWHSLRAIHQYITGKMKSKGFDSIDNTRNSTRLTSLPQYLHFLSVESGWILSNGQSKQCTQDQARTLRAMIKRHLLRHPILPSPFLDSEGTPAPEGLQYFWNNWYRPGFKNVGSRWEIASLCGQPGSSATIPISRTTMRLESHWRILKKDYASRFVMPRLDLLAYIICTRLVRSRTHLYLQVEAGREKPSVYKDFVFYGENLYRADKDRGCAAHLVSFYSCPQADGNGRFLVQPPPAYSPQLFQERLPLIKFSDRDITISSGEDLSDCVDDDDPRSFSYAEELESLELVLAEDPEAAEENDEDIREFMQVVNWASGLACESNPRMQRAFYLYFSNNAASFLAEFKGPYEEAVGISRSVSSNTMRKAPKSYYYSRPQNQCRMSRDE
ncbi:uncharacterized protein V1513DRAFT_460596 [Lipomyces chichibuensis]|uniref:uncharacterized protein n=1 Tax=Lipomyces chichibuensis TaxID=1546026 RepID=UPI00334402AA